MDPRPRPRTAVLGAGEVPWDSPVAPADDAGLRGDGCFETLLVHGGDPARTVRLEEHLDRFARGAGQVGIPFDRAGWVALVRSLTGDVPAGTEAALRLSLSRSELGVATLRPVPATVRAGRDGVHVVTLARGTSTVPDAPWLLTAAKTSSYAVNSAALREARRRGAEDALFLDAAGEVLEAPTANLLWRAQGRWWTPPQAGRAVLPGTTLAAVTARFGVQERACRPGDLLRAEGAWLLSSLRGAAPVRSLDGTPLPVAATLTGALQRTALGL
ncbi:aminotransferase class IV [Kineococcus sp. LSe6-4]|uniref:Aminotransferase class IV n=1 Tax=Kineococcus halophytocola TaxID=3234027 RepID=A0ABV4GY07_9ACTN